MNRHFIEFDDVLDDDLYDEENDNEAEDALDDLEDYYADAPRPEFDSDEGI